MKETISIEGLERLLRITPKKLAKLHFEPTMIMDSEFPLKGLVSVWFKEKRNPVYLLFLNEFIEGGVEKEYSLKYFDGNFGITINNNNVMKLSTIKLYYIEIIYSDKITLEDRRGFKKDRIEINKEINFWNCGDIKEKITEVGNGVLCELCYTRSYNAPKNHLNNVDYASYILSYWEKYVNKYFRKDNRYII